MKPNLTDYQTHTQAESEHSSRTVSWIVLGLALSGFVALAWYAYQSGSESVAQHGIPVVEANNTPTKIAPKDAGGETFPHQDKTIYNLISETEESGVVETLIPEPEEPVIPTVKEVVNQATAPVEKANTWVNEDLRETANVSEVQTASEDGAAPTLADAAPEAAPDVAVPEKNPEAAPSAAAAPNTANSPAEAAPQKETVKDTAASEPRQAIAVPRASHKLQLGAFRSSAEAETYWKRAEAKYSAVLSGLPHQVVRADLPKGTFYRLRVAGFASKASALAACERLSAAGQGCFYAGK
jgi:cell division protein FtsN